MYNSIRPLLFRLKPEHAHRLAFKAGEVAQRTAPNWMTSKYRFEHDALRQSCLGQKFENPVGLAAGFDKNAELLPLWQQLGFGFVEIGSVTAQPSSGNPTPRLFRLNEDEALINRMGLNNDGAEVISKRIAKAERVPTFVLGANIAKTHDSTIVGEQAIADYADSYRKLAPHSDYITLNISCPNTKDGKTFEDSGVLRELLETIQEIRKNKPSPPLLVKLGPPPNHRIEFDSKVHAIVTASLDNNVDGFVASNTASDRTECKTSPDTLENIGEGGLSGKPLRKRSTALVRYIYEMTRGEVPIIGVGGIDSAETAYEKIRAGASLVQMYTGFVYKGPNLPRSIKEGLVQRLRDDGFGNISEAIGVGSRRRFRVD